MIYDCFPFFNELDVLEIRLNILSPFVDKFIIVESKLSHQSKPKKLYYDIYKDTRFIEFKDKIHHVIIDDYPDKSYWGPENYQRNIIYSELCSICKHDDIVFISDLDEIWNPELIVPMLNTLDTNTLYRAKTKVSYFYFNYIATELGDWFSPMFGKFELFKKMHESGKVFSAGSSGIRSVSEQGFWDTKNLDNYSGWHFSYSENPVEKVLNFCHSECAWMDEDYFNNCIQNNLNPFTKNPTMQKIDDSELKTYLPEYVFNNLDKYKRHILQ